MKYVSYKHLKNELSSNQTGLMKLQNFMILMPPYVFKIITTEILKNAVSIEGFSHMVVFHIQKWERKILNN